MRLYQLLTGLGLALLLAVGVAAQNREQADGSGSNITVPVKPAPTNKVDANGATRPPSSPGGKGGLTPTMRPLPAPQDTGEPGHGGNETDMVHHRREVRKKPGD